MQTAKDVDVLNHAAHEGRILNTADKDVGDILALQGRSGPSVVVFRTQEVNPTVQLSRIVQILSEISAELELGAVVVIDKTRIRIRSLPIRES